MSIEEVDQYLAQLDEPKRSTLETLRRTILAIAPGADQGLSYGVPVFCVDGQRIAGFSAAKHHVSYLPHSGSVLAAFDSDDLAGSDASKGALRMPVDTPLPHDLVRRLIVARCAEAGVSI